jgi:hypothetical protein
VNEVSIDDLGMVVVDFAINDNLFEDSIVYGAKSDIIDILHAVYDSSLEYDNVLVAGRFSMRDKYGNVGETQVIGAIYDRSTLAKINWDNIYPDDILGIRDGGFVAPAFSG